MFGVVAEPEWYQRGDWPLVGAIVSVVIAQIFAVGLAVYGATASLRRELVLKRIAMCSDQLSGFYNPLVTLMAANKSVFDNFGPRTLPEQLEEREVAATLWKTLRDRVILPNNDTMLGILRDKSHLIGEADDLSHYAELVTHLIMYRVFTEYPTERYAKYQFPAHVIEQTRKQGQIVKAKLDALKRKA